MFPFTKGTKWMTSQESYDADPISHEIFSTSSKLMVPSDIESKQKTKLILMNLSMRVN